MSAVTVARGRHVVTIRVDDGKANVITPTVIREVGDAIAGADGAAILIEGRNGWLSGGFDLATLNGEAEAARQLVRDGVHTLVRLLRHPRPIVVACTGHAIGFGAFLLLASDLRIGRAGEYRIGLPELAAGIAIPPMLLALASGRLTAGGVGAILAAETMDPIQAQPAGYFDAVDEDPPTRALAEADRLAQLDPAAFGRTKEALREPIATSMLGTLES